MAEICDTFGIVQIRFNFFAGLNILNDSNEIIWGAILLPHQRYGEIDPDKAIILADLAFFQ